MEKWGLIENLLPKNQCCICLFINLNFKVRSFPDKNIQKKMCKWAKLVLRDTVNNRDDNFTGNSGHPSRPTLIGTGMGISYSGIEWVWGIYKNPNQVACM